jgi:hypothetical protein
MGRLGVVEVVKLAARPRREEAPDADPGGRFARLGQDARGIAHSKAARRGDLDVASKRRSSGYFCADVFTHVGRIVVRPRVRWGRARRRSASGADPRPARERVLGRQRVSP